MASAHRILGRRILGRDLRANPLYELVLADCLPEAERRRLPALGDEPGLYGLLRPREPGSSHLLPPRSVDRDTALLLLTLREPSPLPAYVAEVFGEAGLEAVVRLVADGALEIVSGGRFVSGPVALGLLVATAGERQEIDIAGGHLQELSIAAVRYGQALELDRPGPLASRLYAYNRSPLTPEWQRRFAAAGGVEGLLGIAPGGRSRRALEAGWMVLPGGGEKSLRAEGDPESGWLRWRPRQDRRSDRSGRGSAGAPGATYKLYVSPRPEALADTFAALLASFEGRTGGWPAQLKVADDAVGLLRPDKIVAHFATFESLAEGAAALAGRLDGLPVQGVPFTAELGAGGLLSWGVDPPPAKAAGRGRPESWRAWIADRLARGLLAGQRALSSAAAPAPAAPEAASGTILEPWRFALERLRLEGVDVDSWTPGPRLWRQE